jgi:hypothetical protein
MSIVVICSMAFMTRFDFSASRRFAGTTSGSNDPGTG